MLIGTDHLWQNGLLVNDLGLTVANGRIERIAPLGEATPDYRAHLVCPPFTDLQVNGGGGVMVNSDPSPEGLVAVAQAHRRCGTGTILPTVITDRFEVIEAAAHAALTQKNHPLIGGLHIEGPHISPQRRGTHNAAHIRPLDDATVTLVEAMRAKGLRVLLTLAPEHASADLLARLVACGTLVSGGHSAATAEQTYAALDAGLGCFTHLYNAMPPMTSRAPGMLGAALNSAVYAGIIVDGIHVNWDMVRVALRARPAPNTTFAVSDAMATVGGPDSFTLYGQSIAVREGALINAEGSLAGAHIDLRQSLSNLVGAVGLTLTEAMPMVTDTPRRAIGLPRQSIGRGTLLSDTLALSDSFDLLSFT